MRLISHFVGTGLCSKMGRIQWPTLGPLGGGWGSPKEQMIFRHFKVRRASREGFWWIYFQILSQQKCNQWSWFYTRLFPFPYIKILQLLPFCLAWTYCSLLLKKYFPLFPIWNNLLYLLLFLFSYPHPPSFSFLPPSPFTFPFSSLSTCFSFPGHFCSFPLPLYSSLFCPLSPFCPLTFPVLSPLPLSYCRTFVYISFVSHTFFLPLSISFSLSFFFFPLFHSLFSPSPSSFPFYFTLFSSSFPFPFFLPFPPFPFPFPFLCLSLFSPSPFLPKSPPNFPRVPPSDATVHE